MLLSSRLQLVGKLGGARWSSGLEDESTSILIGALIVGKLKMFVDWFRGQINPRLFIVCKELLSFLCILRLVDSVLADHGGLGGVV